MLNKKMTTKAIADETKECGDFQTDEALLLAYANSETQAFELLYSRHKKPLFNYLRRQCSNISIAEELAHDVWLAVIKQANSFEAKALFKTWLYRIAHNRLVDYWRKNGHSQQVLLSDLAEKTNSQSSGLHGSGLHGFGLHGFGSQSPSLDSLSSQDRSSEFIEIEQLLNAVTTLSADQTNAVLLKIEGFTHAEIAQITRSKQETVKSRLRYATKHLRLSMEAS